METAQTIHVGSSPEPVKAIPHRDHERFHALLLTYSPVLYRIALRKLGNAEDAEDALQDALLSALKNMHQFRGKSTVLHVALHHCTELRQNATPAQEPQFGLA